jgi:hypothetical protein
MEALSPYLFRHFDFFFSFFFSIVIIFSIFFVVEIDYHFVRDMIAQKELYVWFISSENQLIDILTKLLLFTHFFYLQSKINVFFPFLQLKKVY